MKPNGRKIFQMVIKYTTTFHSKALQIFPKLGFLFLKTNHLATLVGRSEKIWQLFWAAGQSGYRLSMSVLSPLELSYDLAPAEMGYPFPWSQTLELHMQHPM
jgi:hypothetical protein